MKNIFCVDLEDWFHSNLAPETARSDRSTVEGNARRLLEIFAETATRATFFCLGEVAEKFPALIRAIQAAGHELASHGHAHQLVYRQTPGQFRQDVSRSLAVIEDAAGVKVRGYRAPSWSITRRSLWAIDILHELGLRYDSSIFPIHTFLYGIPDAPRFPGPFRLDGLSSDLLEIPPSTVEMLGRRLAFSGGFFFRVMPLFLIRRFTEHLNRRGREAVFYIHPHEIDPESPRISMGWRDRFISYHNMPSCEKKLRCILNRFSFTAIADFYAI